MKKIMILMLAVFMASCEKVDLSEIDELQTTEANETVRKKKFTFTLKGEFSNEWKPVTRGYLQADGRDLTDVWVLDYVGGELVQQIHQSDNASEDFGKPVMDLMYGNHHIYFIATRGTEAVLDTEIGTITFGKVADTFWKDYEVQVVSTSNGNRAVTLDRVVTKLTLVFTDAISESAARINYVPKTWYYGLNYQTGEPVAETSSKEIGIDIPTSYAGRKSVTASFFGFSYVDEWNTDIVLNSKTSDGAVIGQAKIPNVPFKRNRVTELSGPLFGSGGELGMVLNAEWSESYTGAW